MPPRSINIQNSQGNHGRSPTATAGMLIDQWMVFVAFGSLGDGGEHAQQGKHDTLATGLQTDSPLRPFGDAETKVQSTPASPTSGTETTALKIRRPILGFTANGS